MKHVHRLVRRLAAVIAAVIDAVTTPAGPWHMLVDALFLAFFIALITFGHVGTVPIGRLSLAGAITVVSLSLLGSAWYYLRVWTRWARIRRCSRAGA